MEVIADQTNQIRKLMNLKKTAIETQTIQHTEETEILKLRSESGLQDNFKWPNMCVMELQQKNIQRNNN